MTFNKYNIRKSNIFAKDMFSEYLPHIQEIKFPS